MPLQAGAHSRRLHAAGVVVVRHADGGADRGGGGDRHLLAGKRHRDSLLPRHRDIGSRGARKCARRHVRRGSGAGVAVLLCSHANPTTRGVSLVSLTATPTVGSGARTLRLTPGHLMPLGAPAALVPGAVEAEGVTSYVADEGPS